VILHGDNHFFHRQAQPLRRSLNDSQVGLMGNQPIEIGFIDAVRFKRNGCDISEGLDGDFEYLIATHDDSRIADTCLA